MNLPIQFPNDADVIAEEAARFRALDADDRLRSFRGLLDAGELMIRNSPNAAFLREYEEQERDEWRRAVRDFLRRHGT